jgi:diguanylate cyclase (GGDEF)-like protein/PAS domain S-box-containing protein/putative nucleotidyltransferase with HDIG domain
LDILAVSFLGLKSDLETLNIDVVFYNTIRDETLRLQSNGDIEEARKRVQFGGICETQVKIIMATVNKMQNFAVNKADELYRESEQQALWLLLICFFIIVSAIVVTYFVLFLLKKNIIGPLKELGDAMDYFQQGRMETRSLNETTNELGMIARSFNVMTERIERESQDKVLKAAELLVAEAEISTQAALIIVQKAYYIDKQLFQSTLLSIGDAVISCDLNSNIIFLNKIAETLTGWGKEDAIGQPVENVFYILHELTREKCANIVKQVLLTKEIIELEYNTILISKDGSERPIEDSAAPILNESGELVGAVLVFRDVTEKRDAIRDIEYLSFHDKLTGLYNRRFYEEEIERLNIEKYLPLTLVMCDANGLKLINDSFGHSVGDELLRKASKAIKNACRPDDIVARLGGDEFIAILPNTDRLEADVIIERMKKKISKENIKNIDISFSFGHETKENIDQEIQKIFKAAEDDMYKQKLYESSSMRSETVAIIMKTLLEKNKREMIHSTRVGNICEIIAKAMNLDDKKTKQIRLAGLMHDIGKIGIDESILNETGKISNRQFAEIKRHSEIGYRILNSVNEFSEIANYVLEHHERWDGFGYPRGLKGEEISTQGRIIALADAFDAMTGERSYKKSLSKDEAIKEIARCSGSQFDPRIAKVFIKQAIHF